MIDTVPETRLSLLERQMAELLAQMPPESTTKDWRKTIGRFTNDPVMKEIQEEGRKLREADRENSEQAP